MKCGPEGVLTPIFFRGGGGKNLKCRKWCVQFQAYNFGTEANYRMIKTALELENHSLCSFLTFHLWV